MKKQKILWTTSTIVGVIILKILFPQPTYWIADFLNNLFKP